MISEEIKLALPKARANPQFQADHLCLMMGYMAAAGFPGCVATLIAVWEKTLPSFKLPDMMEELANDRT